MIYLDPHFVNEAYSELCHESIKTYYCSEVLTLRLTKLSPAVAVGFYIKNLLDFHDFKQRIKNLAK